MIDYDIIKGRTPNSIIPDLSILIPTYKRSDFLLAAIDSALNQKKHKCKYEIVIVSNDPEDSLEHLVTRYGNLDNIYIYRNKKNIGMVCNSNKCVSLAQGKYIAFLQDDDLLMDDYLNVFDCYALCQDVDCIVTGRYIFFEKKTADYYKISLRDILRRVYFIPSIYRKRIKKITLKDILKSNTNCYFSPSCGTIIKKETFDNIGGFNDKIPYSWDLEFFLRLNNKYAVYILDYPCGMYRISINASLKNSVKWDFHKYRSGEYYQFMLKNHVDDNFIKRYKREICATVYMAYPEDIALMLKEKNMNVPQVNKFKWILFRMQSVLYYYNHNLDIQKLYRKEVIG